MYGILVYHIGEIQDLPISEFERPLEEKRIALKAITNYQWDNTHYCFESCYGLFAFSINREKCGWGSIQHKELQKLFGQSIDTTKCYTIHLWDQQGQQALYTSIFQVKDCSTPIPLTTIREIAESMKNHYNRFVVCSDCKKLVHAESKNRYFAGTYCKDCWIGTTGQYKDKGGWREVESNETYN